MLKLPTGYYPKPTRAGWVKTPELAAICQAAEKWSQCQLGYALSTLREMKNNGEDVACSYLQSAIMASLYWKTELLLTKKWKRLKIDGNYKSIKMYSSASTVINLKKWLAGDFNARVFYDRFPGKGLTVYEVRVRTGIPIGMKIIKSAVVEYESTQ